MLYLVLMLGYALKPCSNRSDPYSILLEESGSGKTAPWMTALIEPRQRRNDGRHHHTHTHKSLASSSPPSPHSSMAMAKFLRSGGEWALESNIGALIITCTLLGVPSYSSRMIYPKTRFELFKVTKQDKRKERYKLTNDNPTNGPTGAFKIRKRIPERRKTALNPKP